MLKYTILKKSFIMTTQKILITVTSFNNSINTSTGTITILVNTFLYQRIFAEN